MLLNRKRKLIHIGKTCLRCANEYTAHSSASQICNSCRLELETCPECGGYKQRQNHRCHQCSYKFRDYTNQIKARRKCHGPKHPRWKPLALHARKFNSRPAGSTAAYKIWKKLILLRFNFKCIVCGNSTNLVAHHLLRWKYHREHRYNPQNGVLVCVNCHYKIHRKDGSLVKLLLAA